MKSANFKIVLTRWIFVVTFILFVYVVTQFIVVSKQASAITVSIPSYTHDILFNDVELRAKYLASRVMGTNFFVYSVKPKENLWKIAKKYGYSIHNIIGMNPHLKTYDVNLNQKILLSSNKGSLHPIQDNDTWQTIAKRYNVDIKMLRKVNCGIVKLVPGEYIFVPGANPAIDLMNKDIRAKYELRSLFRSPLNGRYSSFFGKRKHPLTGQFSFHEGVDIVAPSGSCVRAAADGVVTIADYNVGHYGAAVFINHKDGYITHYGHLSFICVSAGQKVKKGQLIAKSGATGRVTGPHLHFTIKKGGKALDPMKFMW